MIKSQLAKFLSKHGLFCISMYCVKKFIKIYKQMLTLLLVKQGAKNSLKSKTRSDKAVNLNTPQTNKNPCPYGCGKLKHR